MNILCFAFLPWLITQPDPQTPAQKAPPHLGAQKATQKYHGPRRLHLGQMIPDFDVSTLSGGRFSSKQYRGKTLVVIYLAAEQKDSEAVVSGACKIIGTLDRDDIGLVFLTADYMRKSYFSQLWKDREIQIPLGFDAGRQFYRKAGIVSVPTTLLIDKKGRLDHVLSAGGTDFAPILDAFVKQSLGLLDDSGLRTLLAARNYDGGALHRLLARHRSAARSLRNKGDIQGAQRELKKALQSDPDNLPIQLDLAEVLLQSDRPAEAGASLDHLLRTKPLSRRGRMLRGIAWFMAKDYAKAEVALKEALVANPAPARTYYYLGLVCEQTQRKDEALEHFRTSARLLLEKRVQGVHGS